MKLLTRDDFDRYDYNCPGDKWVLVEYDDGLRQWTPKPLYERLLKESKIVSAIEALLKNAGLFDYKNKGIYFSRNYSDGEDNSTVCRECNKEFYITADATWSWTTQETEL